MNDDFYDWTDDAIAPLTPAKAKQAEEIRKQVEDYLDAGGHIEWLPYDPIPEMVDMALGSLKPNYPTYEGMTAARGGCD